MSRLYEVTITNTGSITVKADNPDQAYDIVLDMTRDEIIKNANLCSWEPSDVQEISDGTQETAVIPTRVKDDAFWINCDSKTTLLYIFKELMNRAYKSSSIEPSPHEESLEAFEKYYKDMLWKPTCFLIKKKKKTFYLVHSGYINTMTTKYPIYNAKDVDLETLFL